MHDGVPRNGRKTTSMEQFRYFRTASLAGGMLRVRLFDDDVIAVFIYAPITENSVDEEISEVSEVTYLPQSRLMRLVIISPPASFRIIES